MLRMSRTRYFMEIARTVAKRSTCTRASVGAVVTDKKNRILATGYNGSPSGHPHCIDVGCKTITIEGKEYCIRTIHAEANAVLTVDSNYDSLTLYCTHEPCFDCTKLIAARGNIVEVKYIVGYADPRKELLKDEYRNLKFTHVSLPI